MGTLGKLRARFHTDIDAPLVDTFNGWAAVSLKTGIHMGDLAKVFEDAGDKLRWAGATESTYINVIESIRSFKSEMVSLSNTSTSWKKLGAGEYAQLVEKTSELWKNMSASMYIGLTSPASSLMTVGGIGDAYTEMIGTQPIVGAASVVHNLIDLMQQSGMNGTREQLAAMLAMTHPAFSGLGAAGPTELALLDQYTGKHSKEWEQAGGNSKTYYDLLMKAPDVSLQDREVLRMAHIQAIFADPLKIIQQGIVMLVRHAAAIVVSPLIGGHLGANSAAFERLMNASGAGGNAKEMNALAADLEAYNKTHGHIM